MSAFLGPIHYWLFKKIKFQDELVHFILENVSAEEKKESILQKMDADYGVLENGELADIIDESNIHGWLQERITVVENRLAYLVTTLTKENPVKIHEISAAAYKFGKGYPMEKGCSLQEAYQYLDSLILNGMPCDRVNEITNEDDNHIAWKQTTDIHASYWKNAGNVEFYYTVRTSVIRGMFENTGVVYQQMGEQSFEIRKVQTFVSREERMAKTKSLIDIQGHPLQLFSKENEALKNVLENAKAVLHVGNADKNTVADIRELAIHYAKKGDILYPLLKVRYGIAGPSDVMWTDDDEIRDELARLSKDDANASDWKERFEKVISQIEGMIYKEENIVFPNCAINFTEDEWIGIYHDLKDYEECFGVKAEKWESAELRKSEKEPSVSEQEVIMAGGHMSAQQLEALLNTLPFEITFVDADNINRFFNEGPKDFKRPQMAIDREVFSCHPPKVETQVRNIINQFRAGTLDEVPVWMEKNGKTILVKYMAVRDKKGNYLGTVEIVQNMDFAKKYFLPKKQSLDEN